MHLASLRWRTSSTPLRVSTGHQWRRISSDEQDIWGPWGTGIAATAEEWDDPRLATNTIPRRMRLEHTRISLEDISRGPGFMSVTLLQLTRKAGFRGWAGRLCGTRTDPLKAR